MNFDQAFDRLINHEGGYVNDSRDPGGQTKYGISKRSYPYHDILNMTLDQAKAIYRKDFWNAVRADELPEAVRFSVFDTAVNAGIPRAIRFLQRAARVDDDGVLGPITMQAVASANPGILVARFNGYRMDHLNDLKIWPTYGRGWSQRIAENLMEL